MGDWLTDLPLESDVTDMLAPEDEIPADLLMALGDVWESTPLDTQAYKKALKQERRGTRPPNLREGDKETFCGNCAHYDKGVCGLYTYPVNASQVCDAWESAD